jgi:hypothetical protein
MSASRSTGLLDRIIWLFSRAWLISGSGALVVSLVSALHTAVFLSRALSVQGSVVGLSQSVSREDNTINYAAVFTFKGVDQKVYTVTSGVATNPPSFGVGDSVRVVYLESDPSSAKLKYFWQLWFVPILCAGLGAFFAGAGYLLLRFERRRTPNKRSTRLGYPAAQA